MGAISSFLKGYRTYLVALSLVIAGLIQLADGNMSEGFQTTALGLMGVFGRAAVADLQARVP